MIWMKRCSRCRGDLYMDADMYGTFIGCLQCGYILPDVEQFVLLHPRTAHELVGAPERRVAKAA